MCRLYLLLGLFLSLFRAQIGQGWMFLQVDLFFECCFLHLVQSLVEFRKELSYFFPLSANGAGYVQIGKMRVVLHVSSVVGEFESEDCRRGFGAQHSVAHHILAIQNGT